MKWALLATFVALLAFFTSIWLSCSTLGVRSTWWLRSSRGPVRWAERSLPVPLYVDATATPRFRRRVTEQVKKINRAAGRTLISEEPRPSFGGGWIPGAINVTFKSMNGGLCSIQREGEDGRWISAMLIEVGPDAHPDVVLHELLHAVGVGHAEGDECPRAVMCPQLYDGAKFLRCTKERLRRVYALP